MSNGIPDGNPYPFIKEFSKTFYKTLLETVNVTAEESVEMLSIMHDVLGELIIEYSQPRLSVNDYGLVQGVLIDPDETPAENNPESNAPNQSRNTTGN